MFIYSFILFAIWAILSGYEQHVNFATLKRFIMEPCE